MSYFFYLNLNFVQRPQHLFLYPQLVNELATHTTLPTRLPVRILLCHTRERLCAHVRVYEAPYARTLTKCSGNGNCCQVCHRNARIHHDFMIPNDPYRGFQCIKKQITSSDIIKPYRNTYFFNYKDIL